MKYVLLISLAVHVLATIIFFAALPMPFGLLALSAAGVAATLAYVAAACFGLASLPLKVLGVLAALVGTVGWGSWILVELTSEPGDPVINITGILILPSAVMTAIATIARYVPRQSTTFGWVHAIVMLIGWAYSMYTTFVDSWSDTFALFGGQLVVMAAATSLFIIASSARVPSPARVIALAAGALGILSPFLFLTPWGSPIAAVLALGSTLAEKQLAYSD